MNTPATSPAEEAEAFPVFTYGTLRPGQYNERILRDDIVPGAAPLTAHLPGYRLYANKSESYPYLVKSDLEADRVTGTLYLVRPGAAFQRTRRMELGAGYDEELVTVTLEGGRGLQALAWTWSRMDWLGPLITSGDWCAWSEHNFPRWSGAFAG